MTQALTRIKGNTTEALPETLLRTICRDLQLQGRERTLTPVVTTYLFLQQILHGNTPVGNLRHLSGLAFTEAAYCQARQRLPVGFFHRLQRAVTAACRDEADPQAPRWRGHRVFLLDGSSFSMPDTEELRQEFGQPGNQAPGCGFPTAHLLVAFDAQTGLLTRAVAAPGRTHDLRQAAVMHQDLGPGDLVVGDRAFGSYAHLALCRQRKLHGLFRAHQRRLIAFGRRRRSGVGETGQPRSELVRRLGRHDQLVRYVKPRQRPAWMTPEAYAALPEALVVREVRFRVRQPGRRTREVTVVTTLLDPQRYPAEAVAQLYAKRWQAEVDLRHLKTTLGMDVLRCQTFCGVMKELLRFVVVYNLVRRVMVEAGRRQGVRPDRISFVDALRWLRQARRGEDVPRLRVNPERPGRVEPRAQKRRPKQYDRLNQPRAVLRAKLLQQGSPPKKDAA
jgi:hypothetical protein